MSLELRKLYELYGNADYIGEEVTQLEHAMQCATLALEEKACNDLVVAAFLHDVGHLIGLDRVEKEMGEEKSWGIAGHEMIGGEYLTGLGCSDVICKLVVGHVATKRYLVAKNTNYYNELSQASQMTLQYQGGPLTDEECIAYEADPLFEWHLKIRQWDDKAKIVGWKPDSERIWACVDSVLQ